MHTEEPKQLSDPETVRALAHPARVAVLDYLESVGEATATECAKVAGMSPSAMSYHLRTLAKVGLIEDADSRGDGRERVWRRRVHQFSVQVDQDAPAGLKLTGRAVIEVYQRRSDEMLHRWLDAAFDEPREWFDQMQFNHTTVIVTPEELTEIKERLAEVLAPYLKPRRLGNEPEGSRAVAIHSRIFPEVGDSGEL